MLSIFLSESWSEIILLMGILFSFACSFVLLATLNPRLPRDGGRKFAHDGEKSAGKARGAGVIFISVFTLASLLFAPIKTEYVIYLVLIMASMLTGFLDDAAATAWGELKKGLLDLLIAVLLTATYLYYNGSDVRLLIMGFGFHMPMWLFAILSVILIWTSVNVTNCSDGVDGLSGTLATVTLLGMWQILRVSHCGDGFGNFILIFLAALMAYLWFNSTPSVLMMGDAGSRAMGVLIALAALLSRDPFLYVPMAIVLIVDGGIGLVKVFLLRYLKISILKNTRTPLHDFVRKTKGWSNTQCVYRFVILQLIAVVIVLCLI